MSLSVLSRKPPALLGSPTTLSAALLPMSTSVVRLSVLLLKAPPPVRRPPATLSMLGSDSLGLSMWLMACTSTDLAVTSTFAPTAAVTVALTVCVTSAPLPASRPPASVASLPLKRAVCSAVILKAPLPPAVRSMLRPPLTRFLTRAVVLLVLMVSPVAAATAIAPTLPATVWDMLSSVPLAMMVSARPVSLTSVPSSAVVVESEEACERLMPSASRPTALLSAIATCLLLFVACTVVVPPITSVAPSATRAVTSALSMA